MFKRIKPVFENVGQNLPHEDYEVVQTRVSDYLRKYGSGQIESMPQDTRAEIHDERSVDEMLDDERFEPGLGTDQLDIIMEIDKNRKRFEDAINEMELTKKQRDEFDAAVKILNDANSSVQAREDAYKLLQELEQSGKLKKPRRPLAQAR